MSLVNVRPKLALKNVANRRSTHTKFGRQSSLRNTSNAMAGTNFSYLILSQFCITIMFTKLVPIARTTLGNTVGGIVRIGPFPQVVGIATRRVIAGMKRVWFWQATAIQVEREPMGFDGTFGPPAHAGRENTIPIVVVLAQPRPTLIAFAYINLLPKTRIGGSRMSTHLLTSSIGRWVSCLWRLLPRRGFSFPNYSTFVTGSKVMESQP